MSATVVVARQFGSNEYAALKAASGRLVHLNGGGAECARVTRLGQQDFSRRISHSEEHAARFLPLDVIADLEHAAGEPEVTRTLAKLQGYELVQLPDVTPGNMPLARVTGEALKDTSEVFAGLGKAMDEGKITRAEDKKLAGEIDAAIEQLLRLKLQIGTEVGR